MKSAKTFTQTSIRDWLATEQPTYRAAQYGTNALSSAELLHLVLGLEYVEPINALLSKAGNLVALSNMPVEEIEGFDHRRNAASVFEGCCYVQRNSGKECVPA